MCIAASGRAKEKNASCKGFFTEIDRKFGFVETWKMAVRDLGIMKDPNSFTNYIERLSTLHSSMIREQKSTGTITDE